MIRNGLFFVIAGLLAAVGTAEAADLPVKVPPAPSAPVPVWTGFYIGGNVGGGFSHKEFIDNFPVFDGVLDGTASPSGWVGGLQAGYNYQISSFLLGVEGGFTWFDMRRSFFSITGFGPEIFGADPEWMAAVAGRVGIVAGPLLIYGKAGPAWIRDTYTNISLPGAPLPGDLFVGHDIRLGWTAGGGVEYMFTPNWSLRVEYDYAAFPGRSVSFFDTADNFFTEFTKQNMQMITAGVNYHFGAPAAVVAAAPMVTKAGRASADENEPEAHVRAFTGVDVGKWSTGGWAGALISPWGDLDKSGPRVWLYAEGGGYKYGAEDTLFKGTYVTGDVLIGYGFEGETYSINILAGLNANNQMVKPFDPENVVQGTEGGFKVRGDAYTTPTTQTMTYGEAEYATAFHTYFVSQKVGYDITNGKEIYIGPIAEVLGDQRYNQWRVGGHVSNIKLGKLELDFAAGYADDSVVGTGAFGTVEASTKF
jgi:outer membrane immunogenic protein